MMSYRDRIVRLVGEASGQRALIESVDDDGRTFSGAVKWAHLTDLNGHFSNFGSSGESMGEIDGFRRR